MTTENNKIIAEFMNFPKITNVRDSESGKYYDYWLPHQDCVFVRDLIFHLDWNWLMEVVEKIETTSFDITQTKPYLNNKDRFKGTTSLYGEFIIGYDDREEFKGWTSYIALGTLPSIIIKDFENRFNTKIEAYYNACLEFIKWYNENKI